MKQWLQELKKSRLALLKSALTDSGDHTSDLQVRDWLQERNLATRVEVNPTRFSDLDKWSFDSKRGSLVHESGKFFSIEGIRVRTNWSEIGQWDQPIINQPEIGYLGLICREIDGVLQFLVQAKVEPGNIQHVQLSPTLQATRSNYRQIHQGRKPLYLEYFQQARPDQILIDQLQSEQGARFLRKRNRNMIIRVDEALPEHEDFRWLTLAQIKSLMRTDNLVNMDTRTVISAIPFTDREIIDVDLLGFLLRGEDRRRDALLKSALCAEGAVHSDMEIITFLTGLKCEYDLALEPVRLQDMDQWELTDSEIVHSEGKYFKVIGVDVEIEGREVQHWSQPMVQPAQEGLCAFVCKEFNGLMHFAVQAKLECGNHDIVEFAPTVQCLTGNYRQTAEGRLPFLEYVLSAPASQIHLDTMQSEEGGRFYREQNRNMIIVAGDELDDELSENHIWMTLNQLSRFLQFNNYINIQARSLIAAVSFT